MKALLLDLLWTIRDMVTSKKALAAIGTIVSQALMADPDARKGVLVTGVAYLLGQGAADFGKSAAVVATTVAGTAPITNAAVTASGATTTTTTIT